MDTHWNTFPFGMAAVLLILGMAAPAFAQDAEAPAAETAAPGDLEPIAIALPEPFYGGTPCTHWSPNLEPESYEDRPPFLAPKGTANVAKGKAVTSSDESPLVGKLEQITDGDKGYAKKSLVELDAGVQWVQVDLEQQYAIYAILVWHFHEGKRVYFDLVAKVSNDPAFKDNVELVYNNDYDNSSSLGIGKDREYIESYQGRLIDTKGVKGRYVRLYSQGNTANELNHYVEVEVFGKSAASETVRQEAAGKKSQKTAGVRHMVLLKFKEGTTEKQIETIHKAFLDLKNKIGTVQELEGGRDMSPEGLNKGFTHGYIVTFADEAGRDAYLPHEAHQAFVALLRPHMEDVCVVDFKYIP